MNSILMADLLSASSRAGGVRFYLEHTAIHIEGPLTSIPGFIHAGGNSGGDFWESEGLNLETLKNPETPTHYGIAVRTRSEFNRMISNIKGLGRFKVCAGHEVLEDDLLATIFKHTETREHIQMIWRKNQIFSNIFS